MVGAYPSVSITSEANSGSAILSIFIDNDDRTDVLETLIVDFSTDTKRGALGFPIE